MIILALVLSNSIPGCASPFGLQTAQANEPRPAALSGATRSSDLVANTVITSPSGKLVEKGNCLLWIDWKTSFVNFNQEIIRPFRNLAIICCTNLACFPSQSSKVLNRQDNASLRGITNTPIVSHQFWRTAQLFPFATISSHKQETGCHRVMDREEHCEQIQGSRKDAVQQPLSTASTELFSENPVRVST